MMVALPSLGQAISLIAPCVRVQGVLFTSIMGSGWLILHLFKLYASPIQILSLQAFLVHTFLQVGVGHGGSQSGT